MFLKKFTLAPSTGWLWYRVASPSVAQCRDRHPKSEKRLGAEVITLKAKSAVGAEDVISKCTHKSVAQFRGRHPKSEKLPSREPSARGGAEKGGGGVIL